MILDLAKYLNFKAEKKKLLYRKPGNWTMMTDIRSNLLILQEEFN